MSEPCWIWQCEQVIPSKTGAGGRVMEELLDQLQQQDWIEHDLFGIRLAMDEALANAIKHGNQLDTTKRVHVCCRMTPDLVRIEIADEGNGFDPSTIPDPTDDDHLEIPRGRGIMLMRSFMSRVEYNTKGNRITMEKTRGQESES